MVKLSTICFLVSIFPHGGPSRISPRQSAVLRIDGSVSYLNGWLGVGGSSLPQQDRVLITKFLHLAEKNRDGNGVGSSSSRNFRIEKVFPIPEHDRDVGRTKTANSRFLCDGKER